MPIMAASTHSHPPAVRASATVIQMPLRSTRQLLCGALSFLLAGCLQIVELPSEIHVELKADGSGYVTVRDFGDEKNAPAADRATRSGNVALSYLRGNPAQVHGYHKDGAYIHEESVAFESLAELVLGDSKWSESISLEKSGRRFLLVGDNRWRLRYRVGLERDADSGESPMEGWSSEEIELLQSARDGKRLGEFWDLPRMREVLENEAFESRTTIILTVPAPIRDASPLRAGKLIIEPSISGNTSSWTIPASAALAQRVLLGMDAVVEFYADLPIESVASRAPDDDADAGTILASEDKRSRQEFIDSRFGDEQLQPGLTALELGACKEAFELLEPLAEDGHSDARLLMAGIYLEGFGVTRDAARGLEWTMRAAESGHVLAPATLGLMHLENSDQGPSEGDVRRMLEAAADKELPMAELTLEYVRAQQGAIDPTDAEVAARVGQLMLTAAHDGAPAGMAGEISALYETGDARLRIPKDLVSVYAFKSIEIAGAHHNLRDLQRLADQLTDAQVEEAQAMAARIWKKRPRFIDTPPNVQCRD